MFSVTSHSVRGFSVTLHSRLESDHSPRLESDHSLKCGMFSVTSQRVAESVSPRGSDQNVLRDFLSHYF